VYSEFIVYSRVSVVGSSNQGLILLLRVGQGSPVDGVRVDKDALLAHLLHVLFNDLWTDGYDVLALPVFDQVEGLKGRNNVFGLDAGQLADIFDREVALVIAQDFCGSDRYAGCRWSRRRCRLRWKERCDLEERQSSRSDS